MPKMVNKSIAFAATLAMGLVATAPLYADAVIKHFALSSSTPKAESTVGELHAIQLTFTQVPQDDGRLIRLTSPQGQQVQLSAVQMDAERIMSARIQGGSLVDGIYTVNWRGAGDDGHFVTGEYTFTLQATEASR